MKNIVDGGSRRINALRLKQWLPVWNDYDYDEKSHRRRPSEFLYMFSMKASELRKLSDVYKRERNGYLTEGIQRLRDVSRTSRIQRYVQMGYPYGDLKAPLRNEENLNLRKPGWIPTAIVINILLPGDERKGKIIKQKHAITIDDNGNGQYTLVVPDATEDLDGSLAPFEVIDGQHRLWAFDQSGGSDDISDEFELPVVAFYGLDIAWQAYIFWSVNVSPKKINPSHAFDLYPLLRTQDWLERVGELTVYREARAQELTELMYSHPESLWHNRINMLGERGGASVSQAAWIRALLTTFLGTGRGTGRAGLFHSNLSDTSEPLEWTRPQQCAFLIQSWIDLKSSIENSIGKPGSKWLSAFGNNIERVLNDKNSLLNQDQGIRAILSVWNEIYYNAVDGAELNSWRFPEHGENETSIDEVDAALISIQSSSFRKTMLQISNNMAGFDWRSAEALGVKSDETLFLQKKAYRGSGGYSLLRLHILVNMSQNKNFIGEIAGSLAVEPE